jgi:malonate-semialdehyde dehydrogenase (acetylating) / methylmalonate-semialdehyde dehydrogenase
MILDGQLLNYIGGKWKRSRASNYADVRNPATGRALVRVPLSPAAEVEEAAQAAQAALDGWRRTPPTERVQYLFKFKQLLEEHIDEIARLTVDECGKTLAEAKGELQRGLENVEVATGIPSLMMGYNLEDIARGIDAFMVRQPVGVVAAITPFNFPGMIPLWFLTYAIACGNCFILKPSEKVPMTISRVFDLIDQLGLPPGVISWQARSVSGRGEECGRRLARCRYGDSHPHHRRFVLWLRRTALPGDLSCHHGWRSRSHLHRSDQPGGGSTQSWLRAGTGG